MRFLCKHRPTIHKSRSTRWPIQRVNDLKCQAKIFFYKKKSGNITLTSFCEVHSHPCSERMYRRDTDKINREDDKELIEALLKAKCKAQIIRRRLREENGKIVTVDAVRHAIKSFDKNKDNLKNLNQYRDSLVIAGSSINYDVYGNGTVRFISIATKKMKKAYLNAAPPVIQCDTTYNYETSGNNYNYIEKSNICTL